ncbi:unnamed protein product [Arctogadus glacialis]
MAHTTEGTKDPQESPSGVSDAPIMENGSALKDRHHDDPQHQHHHHHPCPPGTDASPCSSSRSLPSYQPSPSSVPPSPTPIYYSSPRRLSLADPDPGGDRHSLASQDSGLPTLEVSHPEAHTWPCGPPPLPAAATTDDSPATLPLHPPSNGAVRKSSTFPRGRYDAAARAGRAGPPSDSGSVCSASSMSTERSVSNDDALDFVVASDSSVIVALETDESCGIRPDDGRGGGGAGGSSQFSEVSLSSLGDLPRDVWSPNRRAGLTLGEPRQTRLAPLANFFARSLFTKRVKEEPAEQKEAPGWNLFGKQPPRGGGGTIISTRDPRRSQQECETESSRGGPVSPPSLRQNVRKSLAFEPLSTTALILEDRPPNLPAKPAEEALKHRQQYEEMVAQAKKRELKEAQKRRKQQEQRCKLEESIGTAVQTWNQDILPNWTTTCTTRRVRDLWWQGVPPSVRGKVWSLAVGNELNITHELYNICLARAKEKWKSLPTPSSHTEPEDLGSSDRESSLELIKLDISRTFPHLCIFQQGGPYHDVLHSVLGAYTCYRPDVGYVQGMSFIAAVLILNLETADAFIAFSNLLNKPCQMAFFRVDHSLMLTYFAAFEVFFEENLPKLFAHFKKNSLTPDIYLIDWIFTLYSKSLPLDLACRVWDVFCRDGEEFLFRTALGLLHRYQDALQGMDFIQMAQLLTRLPDLVPGEQLFQHIAAVHMTCRAGKWPQVLQTLQKDQERSSPVLRR